MSIEARIENLFTSIISEKQKKNPDTEYIHSCKLQIIRLRHEKEMHEFFGRMS